MQPVIRLPPRGKFLDNPPDDSSWRWIERIPDPKRGWSFSAGDDDLGWREVPKSRALSKQGWMEEVGGSQGTDKADRQGGREGAEMKNCLFLSPNCACSEAVPLSLHLERGIRKSLLRRNSIPGLYRTSINGYMQVW